MRVFNQSIREVIRFEQAGQGQIASVTDQNGAMTRKAASFEAASRWIVICRLLENLIKVFGELARQVSVGIETTNRFSDRVAILVKNNY